MDIAVVTSLAAIADTSAVATSVVASWATTSLAAIADTLAATSSVVASQAEPSMLDTTEDIAPDNTMVLASQQLRGHTELVQQQLIHWSF